VAPPRGEADGGALVAAFDALNTLDRGRVPMLMQRMQDRAQDGGRDCGSGDRPRQRHTASPLMSESGSGVMSESGSGDTSRQRERVPQRCGRRLQNTSRMLAALPPTVSVPPHVALDVIAEHLERHVLARGHRTLTG
jgi:hypothetical protein